MITRVYGPTGPTAGGLLQFVAGAAQVSVLNRFTLPVIAITVDESVADLVNSLDDYMLQLGLTPTAINPPSVTVVFAASPYAVQPFTGTLFVDTSAGPVSIILPDPTQFGFPRQLTLVDIAGTFAVNNCTLSSAGGANVNGAPTKVLNVNREGRTIITNQAEWFVF